MIGLPFDSGPVMGLSADGQPVTVGRFARCSLKGGGSHFLGAVKMMAAFVAEMRDVDQRCRIIGQHSDDRTLRQVRNTFAQPQNRQRAKQPERINFHSLSHGVNLGWLRASVHVMSVPMRPYLCVLCRRPNKITKAE